MNLKNSNTQGLVAPVASEGGDNHNPYEFI